MAQATIIGKGIPKHIGMSHLDLELNELELQMANELIIRYKNNPFPSTLQFRDLDACSKAGPG